MRKAGNGTLETSISGPYRFNVLLLEYKCDGTFETEVRFAGGVGISGISNTERMAGLRSYCHKE